MSYKSKQKRKALRGNTKAKRLLNKYLVNEKVTETNLSRFCSSSLARTQAKQNGVYLTNFKVQRDFKALDTAILSDNPQARRSKNREHAILKASSIGGSGAKLVRVPLKHSVEIKGRDFIKISGLKAFVFQQAETLNSFD